MSKMLLDTQKYSECQLVTAINAAVHLGEPPVDPASIEYERLVDMVGARHGAAISIERAHRYLRIIRVKIRRRWSRVKRALDAGHPVEFALWHRSVGLHSVLVTAYLERERLQYLRAWNFKSGTLKKEWITWEWVRTMFRGPAMDRNGHVWEFDLHPLHAKKIDEERHMHTCSKCDTGWFPNAAGTTT